MSLDCQGFLEQGGRERKGAKIMQERLTARSSGVLGVLPGNLSEFTGNFGNSGNFSSFFRR